MPSAACRPHAFRLPRRARAAAMAFALMIACWATPAAAGSYHTVARGQTLQSVARIYSVSVGELASANRLPAGARLTPGTKLYIPSKTPAAAPRPSTTTSRPASSSPAMPPPTSSARPASGSSSASPNMTVPETVTVRPGESLWSIARTHRVEVAELAKTNGLKSNSALQVGQKLRLPLRGVAIRPAVEVASSSPKPTTVPVSTKTTSDPPSIPGGGTSKPSVAPSTASRAGFQWPVQGKILRRFEKSTTGKHFGLDIGVPRNTPVRAARDGTVVYAGDSISAYGRMVIVDHGGGWASCYAYNSRLLVTVNDRVKRGEVIAESGDSGRGDQPFMQFQLRRGGDAVDPLPYLP